MAPAIAGLVPAVIAGAQTPRSVPPRVVFSREVLPLMQRECLGCHRGSAAPGGWSMESAERLLSGGRHGRVAIPGKGAQSLLVRYLTGEEKPQMPPGKPLSLEAVALVRRWIDEGARIDSMVAPAERPVTPGQAMPRSTPARSGMRPATPHPRLPAAVAQAAPVTALAFSPDGSLLAVAGYRRVRLLDGASGEERGVLNGAADQVLALAWSSDGKRLAGGGGISGVGGEVCIWTVATPATPSRVYKGHSDAVQSLAWRPGSDEFATAGLDRTVRLWDANSGKSLRTLTDHVDAVMAVRYAADGNWLATGSADRTVKLYRSVGGEWRRSASLAHGDGVTALEFHPRGTLLATAALDRQVRIWPLREGGIENPLRAHGEGEPVLCLTFAPDSDAAAWGAQNRLVRIWNADWTQRRRELRDAPDWIYSLALHGGRVVAGSADGRLYWWDAEGKLVQSTQPGEAIP